MEKIIVNPLEVRGLGNVVSPKTLEDFEVYDAELSFEDSVYTMVYDASSVSVGLSVSSGTISVGESVVLTAEVLSGGEPVSGETVSFYDGTSLLGTDETDSDGIATYTASSLGVGSHSLTAEALDKSSSAVTVTVNKLTSTITLSVPSTGTVGTSYTISGTLVPTSGSVKLYENSVLKDTLTVSSGSFSKAITQNSEGTYSYYAVFEGSSTYSSVTSSTGSIVVSDVPTPTFDSIELQASKSILSYADSDSCILSAQLYDGDDLAYISGVSVEFFKGGTSLGTASTDAQGLAEKTYNSAGSGDVSFTASVGTISSETYEIEDCIDYQPMTSNAHQSRWTIPSAVTSASIFGYSSDGWKFGNASSYSRIQHNTSLTSPFCAEFTVTEFGTSSSNPALSIYFYSGGTSTPNAGFIFYSNRIDYNGTTVINHGGVNGAVYRIEFSASTIKLYENDVPLYTGNHSVSLPTQFEFHTGTSRYCVVKDFKLKPL